MSGTVSQSMNQSNGLLTSVVSSVNNGFDLSDLKWSQVVALVGVVLVSVVMWRQVINFIAEEI